MSATQSATADRRLLAFQVVQAGLLGALLWKVSAWIAAVKLYYELPLQQRFFPAFFESATTFAVSYALVVIAVGFLLMTRNAVARRRVAWLTLVGLSVLCLHQGSYNDATFTTAWWTMLWSAWFAGHMLSDSEALLQRGSRLGRAILSMILLGGAAGKWTAEYWSGQVLYEIYFLDRDFWVFNLLRAHCEAETLRELATWYARKVIVVETFCGLTLWAWPARAAAIGGIAIFTSIAIFSNFYLFSVVLSLIGLAAVGLFVSVAEPRLRCGGDTAAQMRL